MCFQRTSITIKDTKKKSEQTRLLLKILTKFIFHFEKLLKKQICI